MKAQNLLLKIIHWLLAVVAITLVVSGLGITEFRVMETITFGLLTKPLSFKIHTNLWIPFLTLLIFHILYSAFLKAYCKNRRHGIHGLPSEHLT